MVVCSDGDRGPWELVRPSSSRYDLPVAPTPHVPAIHTRVTRTDARAQDERREPALDLQETVLGNPAIAPLLTTEILAGLVTSLALIPEVVSFAVIAGVDPKVALYTSCIMAMTIAFVGGRPAMVSAAAGATAR